MAQYVMLAAIAAAVAYPVIDFFSQVASDTTGSDVAAAFTGAAGHAILNTVIVTVASGGIALLLGTLFAWLNEQTDARIGWLTDSLPIVPLMVPPVASAVGWVLLLGPTSGYLNGVLAFLHRTIGLPLQDVNILSFPGLIFVNTLFQVPFAYLVMRTSFRSMDGSLTEAAQMSGASAGKTLRDVTLPGVAPGLGGAAFLMVILNLSTFAAPVIIGTGANVDVLSTYIYRLLTASYPPKTGTAAVLSIFMAVVVTLALFLQLRFGARGRPATGKGHHPYRWPLGAWRLPARVFMLLFLCLAVILPVAGLALASFQPFWDSTVRWGELTLGNYRDVLSGGSLTRLSLENSALISLFAATICVGLMGMVAYSSRRRGKAYRRVGLATTGLPAALPQTMIGLMMLQTFINGPFAWYGSKKLLVFAYVFLFMPQVFQIVQAAVAHVGEDLLQASELSGASERLTFARVVVPLCFPGLVNAWVVSFILMMGEVTIAALVSSVSNPVVGFQVLNLFSSGTYPQLAALSLLLAVLGSLVAFGVLRWTRGLDGLRATSM